MTVLSVSSSSQHCGLSPVSFNRSESDLERSLCWNCRAETFTATDTEGSPAASQARIWPQASLNAHSPIGMISPVSSARGMNLAGDTEPKVEEFHRSKASAPARRPDWVSTLG